MSTIPLTFDDRDAAVAYAGIWEEAGGPNEFNTTTTWTTQRGATARVTFTGTGITVFGTIAAQASPISNYTVDQDPLTSIRYLATPGQGVQYAIPFYSIKDLAQTRHVLMVINDSPDYELFLDYFIVDTGASPGSAVISVASTSSSVSPSPSPSRLGGSAGSSEESSKSTPLGAIIGGVLGALALICVAVVAVFALKWRRKRRGSIQYGVATLPTSRRPDDNRRSISPYVFPANAASASQVSSHRMSEYPPVTKSSMAHSAQAAVSGHASQPLPSAPSATGSSGDTSFSPPTAVSSSYSGKEAISTYQPSTTSPLSTTIQSSTANTFRASYGANLADPPPQYQR